MRIMLHRRQGLHQPPTPLVNEQTRQNFRLTITQPLQDFYPTIHPIHIRRPELDCFQDRYPSHEQDFLADASLSDSSDY
jgi:hypothetical protein